MTCVVAAVAGTKVEKQVEKQAGSRVVKPECTRVLDARQRGRQWQARQL